MKPILLITCPQLLSEEQANKVCDAAQNKVGDDVVVIVLSGGASAQLIEQYCPTTRPSTGVISGE